jgi:hypothetical protein
MILNSTKYKNPQRTISGLLNVVSNADTIILCDTSLGAVAIQLLEIPFDQWSTTYKVYIVDGTANASVNNITITAPTGFTVNNQSSILINTNGGSVSITVASNTGYLGSSTAGSGGGGNAVSVLNEGTQITPAVASLNFVGSLVNATAVGNAVTVTINPNFVVVTYAQLTTLISTSSLIPSQQYLISDAIFINTVTPENTPIVVEAVSTTQLASLGAGFFQNADYQFIGNYSGVTGYVENKGTWVNSIGIYVVGDVVIYNNLQYVNTTGSNSIPTDLTDWNLLEKETTAWTTASTNGYITEIDIIHYNYGTNQISYREDLRFNRVYNNLASIGSSNEAFYVFQWGNDYVINNVIQNESYLNCVNNVKTVEFSGEVKGNYLNNLSFIDFPINANRANFNGNIVDEFSQIYIEDNEREISANTFFNVSATTIRCTDTAIISLNNFKYATSIYIHCKAEAQFILNSFTGANVFQLSDNTGTFTQNIFENSDLVLSQNSNADFSRNFVQNSEINLSENLSKFANNNFLNSQYNNSNQNAGGFENNTIKNSALTLPNGSSGTLFQNTIEDCPSVIFNSCNGNITNNNFYLSTLEFEIVSFTEFNNNTFSNVGSIGMVFNLQTGSLFNFNQVIRPKTLNIYNGASGRIDYNYFENSEITIANNVGSISENKIVTSIFNVNQNLNLISENNIENSQIVCVTQNGTILGNQLLDSSLNFNVVEAFGIIQYNNLSCQSVILSNDTISGNISSNEMNYGTLRINTQTGTSAISRNTIKEFEVAVGTVLKSSFLRNNFTGGTFNVNSAMSEFSGVSDNFWISTVFVIGTDLTFKVENTWCEKANLTVSAIVQDIQGGIFQRNVGTIQYVLDLADKAIYDNASKTLTIPPAYSSFFGEYWLINGAFANPIGFITGLNNTFATKFVCKTFGIALDFQTFNGVATAGTTEIISNQPAPASFPIFSRSNGEDSIYIRPLGNLNGIEQYYQYL